ncbi:ABC transporter ATP-binding protein [Marinobacterium aestuariivivens]|uniref:ABC transporter ATP-binding protein n=1 Tax=Marinobacterium aestuariivivens TaxID=1698799 RepID=A0ABW2A7U2_9GAMM
MAPLIEINSLEVRAGRTAIVEKLNLKLRKGTPLTILGETGSGKSLLAQAIIGLLPKGLTVSGQILIDGRDQAGLSRAQRERQWGRDIGMLPQEPWRALDPLMPALPQVSEVYELVGKMEPEAAWHRASGDLDRLQLANAGNKIPAQLSGGMAQRVAFAAATAGGARIILADEPTKGLDARRRDLVVAQLKDRSANGGLLTITHDIEVARQLGGDTIVMRQGVVVERGTTEQILSSPKSAYARALVAAAPQNWPDLRAAAVGQPAKRRVLAGCGLSLMRGNKKLFSNLDINIAAGEVLALSGDSGTGKTSLGDVLLGLLPPSSGQVLREVEAARYQYQKLYQDPPAAFAPQVTLGRLMEDLICLHRLDRGRLLSLMARLNLSKKLLGRYPHQVSGGELQRLAIARVLMLDPVLLFADEPTSRLDPITARDTTLMLVELARESGCALLLVCHDPLLVEKVADRHLHLGAVAED